MKLIPVQKFPSKVQRLAHKHGYNFDEYEYGWAQINHNGELQAYCLANKEQNHIVIDWIWAKKGKGTPFLKLVERRLFKISPKIELLVSIDKHELQKTVQRRINFYIKNQYRVSHIKYRSSGVLFTMGKVNR